MKDRFNVLGTHGKNTIPWIVIAPHEEQAISNHGQSLEHLNERGGLSWNEMLAVLENRKWDKELKSMNESVAREKVEEIVRKNVCTVQMVKIDDGHYIPRDCCTMTNPATTPEGESLIDDVDLPCGLDCEGNCDTCIVQKIFDEYAEITKQAR